MTEFRILNPKIIGDFNDTVKGSNNLDAADKAWLKISEHITNIMPHFIFTLEEVKTKKLHNFEVNENPKGKVADYSIKEIEIHLKPEEEKNFRNKLSRLTKRTSSLKGGKKKKCKDEDDDDSSTDEEEELYKKIKLIRNLNAPQPIIYWWYSPILYKEYRLPSIYVPTFNAPLVPYVEIDLSSAFLG